MPTRNMMIGLLLIGLALLAYRVLKHFWSPVVWAAILVYITWPLFVFIDRFLKKQSLSALLMTFFLASLIIIPLAWISLLLQTEIVGFYASLPVLLEKKPVLPSFILQIPYLGAEIDLIFQRADDLRALLKDSIIPGLKRFSGPAIGLIENAGFVMVKLGLTLLVAFFFYRDGFSLKNQLKQLLHWALTERVEAYFNTIEETVKAIVYGIVLTAIAQGSLAGLGYWVVGLEAPILLGAITVFFALIPFGTPLVWGSVTLWLLMEGQFWAAAVLGLWGSLLVSSIDNLVRPLVISEATQIPYLLVFFGVIGGLAEFGFIGLFLGPVILAMVLAVWRECLDQQLKT